jgi:protein TonB
MSCSTIKLGILASLLVHGVAWTVVSIGNIGSRTAMLNVCAPTLQVLEIRYDLNEARVETIPVEPLREEPHKESQPQNKPAYVKAPEEPAQKVIPTKAFIDIAAPTVVVAKPQSIISNNIGANEAVVATNAESNPINEDSIQSVSAGYLKTTKVTYPKTARKKHLEGLVMLTVCINAEGIPEKIHIQQGSGFEELDKAAMNAVKEWEFTPGKRGTHDVASEVQIPIRFALD